MPGKGTPSPFIGWQLLDALAQALSEVPLPVDSPIHLPAGTWEIPLLEMPARVRDQLVIAATAVFANANYSGRGLTFDILFRGQVGYIFISGVQADVQAACEFLE